MPITVYPSTAARQRAENVEGLPGLPITGRARFWITSAAPAGLTLEYGRATLVSINLEERMAKLALIYGMRLLPEEDLGEVKDATVVLKNGRTARVTMHLIEGTKEEIESTFRESIEAFFEMYPEI
jgi:hypothetical protein